MALTYEGIEKREYLRVDFESHIEFSLCEDSEIRDLPQGMIKNISSCGVLLESKLPVHVGSIVTINLDFSTLSNVIEIDDSVIEIDQKVLGRIVRLEEHQLDKSFGLGVCFLRKSEMFDEEDVKQVIALLETK